MQKPYESNDGPRHTPVPWFHFPKSSVPALVVEYIAEIVTAPTNKYCTCEWIIHPDDIELPEGVKRRMRKGQTSWDCWIHTKEGLVLGFFTWVFTARKEPDPSETLETLPEVRERVRTLIDAISAGEPYEKVMALSQELSRPLDAEQKLEWEAHPEKQQAVAALLKEQLTSMRMVEAREPGWHDPESNPLEDIKEFVKKNTPKTVLNIKCTCNDHTVSATTDCLLHTGKLIEIPQQVDGVQFQQERLGTWPEVVPAHYRTCQARSGGICGPSRSRVCTCWCHDPLSAERIHMEHDGKGNYIGPFDAPTDTSLDDPKITWHPGNV